MPIKIRKTDKYAMRIEIEIPTEDPDVVEKGDFVAMVPIPTQEFAEEIDELARKGNSPELWDTLILSVSGIEDPETKKEYPPADQLAMVKKDLRLARATLNQYRADARQAISKN